MFLNKKTLSQMTILRAESEIFFIKLEFLGVKSQRKIKMIFLLLVKFLYNIINNDRYNKLFKI
jgi:hypothetical protein